VIAFGALFSRLKVIRRDNSGAIVQTVNVPINYGPKDNMLVRVNQDPDLEHQVRVTVPRLAYEITGYTYDGSRVHTKNQKVTWKKPDGSVLGVFTPAPYNISISMYLLTKGTLDGHSVVEQILPIFMPDYIMSINTVPGLDVTQDVPVILNSVNAQQEYEGDFRSTQLTTHQFDFTLKLNLFGNPGNANLITRVDVPIIAPVNTTVTYTTTGDLATRVITEYPGWVDQPPGNQNVWDALGERIIPSDDVGP
jgi:hypothetical protein